MNAQRITTPPPTVQAGLRGGEGVGERVEALMAELQNALAACNCGPLRAIIDSDGRGMVHALHGTPVSRKRFTTGVPVQMLRDMVGPHRNPFPKLDGGQS